MKKFYRIIFAIIIVLSMGTNVLAAANNGAEYDYNRALNNYSMNYSLNSEAYAMPVFESTVQKTKAPRAGMPIGGGEYDYNYNFWNSREVKYGSNCYGYILNMVHFYEGYQSGHVFKPGFLAKSGELIKDRSRIIALVQGDLDKLGRSIRVSSYSEKPNSNEYKIALVISEMFIDHMNNSRWDFHWYRQDSNGGWSHKRGTKDMTCVDASDNYITDPRTCDRHYDIVNYSEWGGYYIISKVPDVVYWNSIDSPPTGDL